VVRITEGVSLLQTGPVIEKLANRIADSDKPVRSALKDLLGGSLLPQLGEGMLAPFLPLLMAHICSAMTHLQPGIRYIAFDSLPGAFRPKTKSTVFRCQELGIFWGQWIFYWRGS